MQLRYFRYSEFKCSCCGKQKMNPPFLWKLDLCRERCGFPFKVNSGYRCESHNAKVGGKQTSEHMQGEAADISITNSKWRFKIIKEAIGVGFFRIGVGEDFIHLGHSTNKPQMVMWLY